MCDTEKDNGNSHQPMLSNLIKHPLSEHPLSEHPLNEQLLNQPQQPMVLKARRLRRWVGSMAIALALMVSSSAHAFQLQALDAQRVDLMDYVEPGRWTVIMFWATDCVSCEQQKPGLELFHRQHFPDSAAVVGVAIDGYEMIDEIEKLNALHKPSYPNLVAFTDVFRRQYEEMTGKAFRTTPTFVIFNDKGQFHGNVYGLLPLDELSAFIAAQN